MTSGLSRVSALVATNIGVIKEVRVGREKLSINLHLQTLLAAECDAMPKFPKKKTMSNRR
jgi:hypothetical protein